ncbi:MAG: DUF4931 domain-containing protein [Selenomonadaceae bacterium]|nr:DUF4931 domain-containing protein [Selenomonadaceae bacterium]
MDINLIGFDVKLGKQKPENIVNSNAPCPFCDVAGLKDIIATDGDIILLKNKYNVIEQAEQFVIIEGKECRKDMPDYTKEHMRRLIRFSVSHWKKMIATGKYEAVLFFKNFGPMSGGTIRHPHMQLVAFPHIKTDLLFSLNEFEGETIIKKNGVTLNAATCPRVGFGELNIVPEKDFDMDTLADFIQIAVDYLMNHFIKRGSSYNIFFYHKDDNFYVKLMPRFATSPLFIGYNIHFLPNNTNVIANEIRDLYFN